MFNFFRFLEYFENFHFFDVKLYVWGLSKHGTLDNRPVRPPQKPALM